MSMKTVVITGASRGIGLEFVKQLVGAGHKVRQQCVVMVDIQRRWWPPAATQTKLRLLKSYARATLRVCCH